MRILISNDDGYSAPGIRALYDALESLGEVWLSAPASERSGVSHSFTMRDVLRVDNVDWVAGGRGFAVHGMPVDSVKLAIRSLMDGMPDIVVSGINQGENTGVDLLYSGTVAAAMEGAILGVPSVAVSLASKRYNDFSVAAKYAQQVVEQVLAHGIPKGNLINVNVPPLSLAEIKGVRLTKQGASRYIEQVRCEKGKNGVDCHWTEYHKELTEDGAGTDIEAIRDGYVSITPVHARMTETRMLKTLEDWDFGV